MRNFILTNSFSINMFGSQYFVRIDFQKLENPINFFKSYSLKLNAIGHPETDNIIRNFLSENGIDIPKGERTNVQLTSDDTDLILVAQYRGPRLHEGATILPENATIEWWLAEKNYEPWV